MAAEKAAVETAPVKMVEVVVDVEAAVEVAEVEVEAVNR